MAWAQASTVITLAGEKTLQLSQHTLPIMKASCLCFPLVSCGVNAIQLGRMAMQDIMDGGKQLMEPSSDRVDTVIMLKSQDSGSTLTDEHTFPQLSQALVQT